MCDGWFMDPAKQRRVQRMQFVEGDVLVRDVMCPPGVDPHVTASPTTASCSCWLAHQPLIPASDAEAEEAFKLYLAGRKQTLKKRNPGSSGDALHALGRQVSAAIGAAHDVCQQGAYVSRRQQHQARLLTDGCEKRGI